MKTMIFLFTLLAVALVLGCTGEVAEVSEIEAPIDVEPSSLSENDWVKSDDGTVSVAISVPDAKFKKGDSVPATIGIKTDVDVSLQYLLFAKDSVGDTIFSYPLPPKSITAGSEEEFTADARLFETPEGEYYFTILAFDGAGELIIAKDAPVNVGAGPQRMELVVDCFDTADAVDSNLCVYDVNADKGYMRIELRPMAGGIAQPSSVSGSVDSGLIPTQIIFDGTAGEFALPDEEGSYSVSITATAEGYEADTEEFEFSVMDISAIRVNCDLNGECGPFESFGTCPEDCESGKQDWHCDAEVDGRCDPDCLPDEDSDCQVRAF